MPPSACLSLISVRARFQARRGTCPGSIGYTNELQCDLVHSRPETTTQECLYESPVQVFESWPKLRALALNLTGTFVMNEYERAWSFLQGLAPARSHDVDMLCCNLMRLSKGTCDALFFVIEAVIPIFTILGICVNICAARVSSQTPAEHSAAVPQLRQGSLAGGSACTVEAPPSSQTASHAAPAQGRSRPAARPASRFWGVNRGQKGVLRKTLKSS